MSDIAATMHAATAKVLAFGAHAGQTYGGDSYFDGHLAVVARRVAQAGHGDLVATVAWLHDIVEDTPLTLTDLQRLFPDTVVIAVDAITHRDGETREAYYDRVMCNDLAFSVKLADVAANRAALPALAQVDPERAERLAAKYDKALRILTGGGFESVREQRATT